MKSYAIGLDVGTSAVKAAVFDDSLRLRRTATIEIPIARPAPELAEQDFDNVVAAVASALSRVTRGVAARIAGIGLACHRSSIVPFDVRKRRALGPIVLWNDRRAARLVDRVGASARRQIAQRTGLPVLPYFAALRMKSLLGRRELPRHAHLLTIDAALACAFGGGPPTTDPSMAARTLLADDHGRIDDALLELFRIPRSRIAEVLPTVGERVRIDSDRLPRALRGTPLLASIADQSAAWIGLSRLSGQSTTLTIGTGLFAARRGGHADPPRGLMPVVFTGDASCVERGVEANDPSCGAAIQAFCRAFDLRSPHAIDRLAGRAKQPPLIIPTVTGLGAPWLVPSALGAILDWSPNATRADFAGGLLDGIAARAAELLKLVGGRGPIACGGGGASSDALLERIANRSGRSLVRVTTQSTTALGAAVLAWRALSHEAKGRPPLRAARFEPSTTAVQRSRLAKRFAAGVRHSIGGR